MSAASTGLGNVSALGYTLTIDYPTTVATGNPQAPSQITTTSKSVNNATSATTSGAPVTSAAATCFVSGTLIRTTRGEVPVEHLAVGDIVVTREGKRKPIRWLGHRTTRCDRHPQPIKVWPVRISADTFGEGLPYADLWLSPGHSLCLDDALVPVRGLIDTKRIAQVRQESVTYWHVELDEHDVILANGLPAESYLDTGNRHGFDNVDATSLHFDEAPSPGYDGSGYCLPVIESGPRLSKIRAEFRLGCCADKSGLEVTTAVRLVADGIVIEPSSSSEDELRFVVPAGVSELRLVSPHVATTGGDVRRLGIAVSALGISDGAGWRDIELDDPSLYAGFHDVESDGQSAWRWTDGEGHLSPALWGGVRGEALLRVNGRFAVRRTASPLAANNVVPLARKRALEARSPALPASGPDVARALQNLFSVRC